MAVEDVRVEVRTLCGLYDDPVDADSDDTDSDEDEE
jgi:hypothetical protein